MYQLFNYCPIDIYEEELLREFGSLQNLINYLGIDGIEQLIYMHTDEHQYLKESMGIHLRYWPYWIDRYLDNLVEINHMKASGSTSYQMYYGDINSSAEFVDKVRENIITANQYAGKYYVWHVSEATDTMIFTRKYRYDDRAVLTYTAELFNQVQDLIPETTTVLFENLWWPGLRLVTAELVDYFFSKINRTNVGIMLDVGHLANTNTTLIDEYTASKFILSTLNSLGSNKGLIKGIHLSRSLSGTYQRQHNHQIPNPLTPEEIWKHVSSIDQHQPLQTNAYRDIIECVEPQWLVHELTYSGIKELTQKLKNQIQAISS